jgi:hypothetical protein
VADAATSSSCGRMARMHSVPAGLAPGRTAGSDLLPDSRLCGDQPPIMGPLQRGGEVGRAYAGQHPAGDDRPLAEAAAAPGPSHPPRVDVSARLCEGVTAIRSSATAVASMPATRTANAFCEVHINTIGASGRCCAPGCGRTAASLRKAAHPSRLLPARPHRPPARQGHALAVSFTP